MSLTSTNLHVNHTETLWFLALLPTRFFPLILRVQITAEPLVVQDLGRRSWFGCSAQQKSSAIPRQTSCYDPNLNNALRRGKGYGAETVQVHDSESEGDKCEGGEPSLPLKWTVQGRLNATEQALQAAEALVGSEDSVADT